MDWHRPTRASTGSHAGSPPIDSVSKPEATCSRFLCLKRLIATRRSAARGPRRSGRGQVERQPWVCLSTPDSHSLDYENPVVKAVFMGKGV
jgi:hypothetical protein